eukprot:403343479
MEKLQNQDRERKCACTGVRYCKDCNDPEFRKQFKDLYPIDDILEAQQKVLTYVTCELCNRFKLKNELNISQSDQNNGNNDKQDDQNYQSFIDQCIGHLTSEQLDFGGLYTINDFISEEFEQDIVNKLQDYKWVDSQSGRKKIDFGPQVNFKKQKLKYTKFTGFPLFIKPILDLIQTLNDEILQEKIEEQKNQQKPQLKENLPSVLKDFIPIEVNVLEYDEQRGSNIAPHKDDFWLWGERIIGINLLQDTFMTFQRDSQNQIGQIVEIEVPVKRRMLYIISGKSRFEWMHGIKSEHIKGKRIVCTIREFSDEFKSQDNEDANKIRAIAKTYIQANIKYQFCNK